MAAMLEGWNIETVLHENRSYFPEERKCIVFALQHGGNDVTWNCSIGTILWFHLVVKCGTFFPHHLTMYCSPRLLLMPLTTNCVRIWRGSRRSVLTVACDTTGGKNSLPKSNRLDFIIVSKTYNTTVDYLKLLIRGDLIFFVRSVL